METNLHSLPHFIWSKLKEKQFQTCFSVAEKESSNTNAQAFLKQAFHLSNNLKKLGVHSQHHVGIMGPSSAEWLISDFAILSLGAVSVPLFPQLSEEILQFEISDANIKTIIVLGTEGLDKVLDLQDGLDHLILEHPSENSHHNFAELCRGEEIDLQSPPHFEKSELATIIYTSGSTGMPKGVQLSHQNLISQIEGAEQCFPLDPRKDVILSCLPLAHIFERMVVYFYICSGVPIHFVQDITKIGDAMKQIRPTVMTLVPRLLEKVFQKMNEKVQNSSGIKKVLGQWALKLASEHSFQQKNIQAKLANKLVYQKLREAFGGRIRLAISGGAALAPQLHHFFVNIGIPVFQGYGLTECSPVLAANYPEHQKIGSVGKAFPKADLKIDPETGEILAKGPNLMFGYLNRPEETKKMIDHQGWLHTGDQGQIDHDGYLTITGRIKELFKTSNGKYVSPIPIEHRISSYKWIDMAMVIAEGRNFTTCLIFLDWLNIEDLKSELNLKELNDEQFQPNTALYQLIDSHIQTCNASLNHWEQIKKFAIIPDKISIETGELTPTMKIKRHFIEKKYKLFIEQMYNSSLSL